MENTSDAVWCKYGTSTMTKKCKLEVVRLSNPWEKHYKIYKSVHPRIQYNSIPYSTLLAYPSDQTVCHRYKAIINNIQYSYVYIYYIHTLYGCWRFSKIICDDATWYIQYIHLVPPCILYHLVPDVSVTRQPAQAVAWPSPAHLFPMIGLKLSRHCNSVQHCNGVQHCSVNIVRCNYFWHDCP